MSIRPVSKAVIAGIISGVALGLFLKIIESGSGLKVYTLLLNVDYIPVVNTMELTESAEFGLHLIISIVLSICIQYYLLQKNWMQKEKLRFAVKVSLIVGLLLYPTTLLSERTPEMTNLYAFLFWMIGHSLHGWVLGILLVRGDRRRP
jgi:hypothetical protein